MIAKIKTKKGQSALEVAIVLVAITGALIAIQIYLKRGIEGKLRSNADELGYQYDPGGTTNISETLSSYNSSTKTTVDDTATSTTTKTDSSSSSTETYSGTETSGAY